MATFLQYGKIRVENISKYKKISACKYKYLHVPVFPVYKTTRSLDHGLIIGIFPDYKTMVLYKTFFSGDGVSHFRL